MQTDSSCNLHTLWCRLAATALLLILAACFCHDAAAHARGEDYVFTNIRDDSIDGNIQIHVSDLKEKLGLDIPRGKGPALAAIRAAAPQVHDYIRRNLAIGPVGEAAYAIEFKSVDYIDEQGGFARYEFTMATGPVPDRLQIVHNMLYENDPFHRGLFLVDYNSKTGREYGEEYTALVFSPTNPTQILDLTDVPGLLKPGEMIWQGMLHIGEGIDHILFLLSLVLPTVLLRKDGGWIPVPGFPRAFLNLVTIVTVFTVVHSFSLLLAAFDYISLNAQFVESMIALSIVLVAWNNIFSIVRRGSLWIILLLGLFHGLGFASVLGNLSFRMVDLVKMVLLFNIGVELGQIVIVAVLFPLLFVLRRQSFYVPVILKGGSIVLMIIAGTWFFQRAFTPT